jgi:hypothetical protein
LPKASSWAVASPATQASRGSPATATSPASASRSPTGSSRPIPGSNRAGSSTWRPSPAPTCWPTPRPSGF